MDPSCVSGGGQRTRQNALEGLVTIGSFPGLPILKEIPAARFFVRNGIQLFGGSITVFRPEWAMNILDLLSLFPCRSVFNFRASLLLDHTLRIIAFPIVWLLNFASGLSAWNSFIIGAERIENFGEDAPLQDGGRTFPGILRQFASAISENAMKSLDGTINYSGGYHRLRLPCFNRGDGTGHSAPTP